MTEDDVAVLLNGYAAWNRDEFDTIFEFIDPEIAWLPTANAIESGLHTGRGSLREFMESWRESFDDLRVEPELLIQKDDTAIVIARQSGRGHASGIELGAEVVHVWTVREGRAVGFWAAGTREQALEALQEETVTTMLRSYEAFNRGDLEQAISAFDPEVVWHTWIVPGPGGASYKGHEGVRELWSDARNVFGDFRNVPERIVAAGDKIVAFISVRGRGKESGVEVEGRIAHVHTFRGSKVTKVESYEDRDEALRAAGLAPP
jgi:ketosteroid isomerase-like protein